MLTKLRSVKFFSTQSRSGVLLKEKWKVSRKKSEVMHSSLFGKRERKQRNKKEGNGEERGSEKE